MKCFTKNGLLFLIIMQVLTLISVFLLYGLYFSYDFGNITTFDFNSLFMIIPSAAIGGIGGLIGLIGALFLLLGRKEFGEKHSKFIIYAIIIFIIGIVVNVILVSSVVFMSMFSSDLSSLADSSTSLEFFQNSNFITITFLSAPISAIFGGLTWLFGLYNLEDKRGRIYLFSAVICSICINIITAILSIIYYNNWVNSAAFEEFIESASTSSVTLSSTMSAYTWLGATGVVSLIGGLVAGILFILALYNPYKRISSGEFVPIQKSDTSEPDRRCPNCGRGIPDDANVCPYCQKQFDTYL